MTASDIAALIGDLGFPIVVAGYLLIRGDKMMRDILAELRELTRETRNAKRST